MDRTAVVIVQLNGKTSVMVLDGIETMDRPAAIGYFVLEKAQEHYRRYKKYPELVVRLGHIESNQLEQRARQGYEVYTTKMHGPAFGEIYRLVTAVETGCRSTLDS